MISKILLLFVAVIFRSSAGTDTAADTGRYNLVDNNDFTNGNDPQIFSGNIPRPYNIFELLKFQYTHAQRERVRIQLYYECHCPICRNFNKQFKQTILALASYLDVHVYPYGNAQTEEHNGCIRFTCEHGPAECYGNKLHACAINYIGNITSAVLYNSCMMDFSQSGQGSDDAAADACSRSMGIDSEHIKNCAKGPRGTVLLKQYGVESKKANFRTVPYILINGCEPRGNNFMRDVCNAFKNPPQACARDNWVE